MQSPIVSTDWLEAHLSDANLVLLDASMASVVGKEPIIYEEPICIPCSRKFDIEQAFCDTHSSQIHALPTPVQFTQGVQALGINRDSLVVIYDNQGIYSSPRAWWMFKVMGFENVFVLDGGLPQWIEEDRVTSSRYQSVGRDYGEGDLVGVYQAELVIDSAGLLPKIGAIDTAIFDARGAARFAGTAAEPRAGVRAGHIPHSYNVPFLTVLDGHKLKSAAELKTLFTTRTNPEQTRIFSCGSGITACILILASVVSGEPNAVLYDGSWADWGSRADFPISQS